MLESFGLPVDFLLMAGTFFGAPLDGGFFFVQLALSLAVFLVVFHVQEMG